MNKRLSILAYVLLFVSLMSLTGCCQGKYSFYSYKKKGEEALKAKNYKKAQNFYSIIYQTESKKEPMDMGHCTWAFYRLGVIAELTGDLKRARGYYWGDSIDEGYYESERLTNWFAQAGWKQLDEKNKARTLEEILEFEKTEPIEEQVVVERKKEIIIPKKPTSSRPTRPDTSGVITKTYNRSKTPPPPGVPQPFKVYY